MVCPRIHELPPPPAGKTGWPWTEETDPLPDSGVPLADLPKISIITPSYNQGGFIEETIRSVLLQGYPDLEYIIIDGGSQDDTVNIIQKYEPWLQYWVSEKDRGQSEAINKGIKKCSGDVLNWLNSDDYYTPGALLRIGETFAANSALKCVIGKINFFGPGKSFLSTMPAFVSTEKTAGYAYISQPAMFFSHQAHRSLGPLNENLHYCMDIEWWIKFLLQFGIRDIQQIKEVLVQFRLHDTSKSVALHTEFTPEAVSIYYSIAKQFGFTEKQAVLESFGKVNQSFHFELPPGTDRKIVEKMLDYYLLMRGEQHYVDLDKEKAQASFRGINTSSLAEGDKKFLAKLRFRNSFLPKWLILSLRKR